MKRVTLLAACLLTISLVAGCASQPQVSQEPITGDTDEPLWVSKGINAFPEAGEALGGVGIAERKEFPTLYARRTAAINRARLDVAAQLTSLVQGVFKDYVETAFTPSMDEGTTDTLTTIVQKNVVDEQLVSSTVEDVYVDKATGDYYAFVKLSMDGVAERLRNTMYEVEKNRLRIDADKAHEELDQIIEKYRKQRYE